MIGGSVIEFIDSWLHLGHIIASSNGPHLGHIIASSNDDNLDILNRRNSL